MSGDGKDVDDELGLGTKGLPVVRTHMTNRIRLVRAYWI